MMAVVSETLVRHEIALPATHPLSTLLPPKLSSDNKAADLYYRSPSYASPSHSAVDDANFRYSHKYFASKNNYELKNMMSRLHKRN